MRRDRQVRDVRVNEFERIVAHKRRPAAEQLVQHGSEAVVVAAQIDGPVDATGLFRADVIQIRAGARGSARLQRRGQQRLAETGNPNFSGCDVDEYIRRLKIVVNDFAAVYVFKGGAQAQRDAQKCFELDTVGCYQILQRFAVEFREHRQQRLLMFDELNGLQRRGAVDPGG